MKTLRQTIGNQGIRGDTVPFCGLHASFSISARRGDHGGATSRRRSHRAMRLHSPFSICRPLHDQRAAAHRIPNPAPNHPNLVLDRPLSGHSVKVSETYVSY